MRHTELFSTEREAQAAGRNLAVKGYGYTVIRDTDAMGHRAYRLNAWFISKAAA